MSTVYDSIKAKVAQLTSSIISTIENEEPAVAENATLVDNKTPTQLKALVTKDTLGLSLLKNYPLATDTQAIEGIRNDVYLNPKQVKSIAVNKIGQVQGLKGQILTIGSTSAFSNLFGKSLLEKVDIVDNNTDRTATLNGPVATRTVMIDSRNLETRVWNGSSWITQGAGSYLTHLKRNSFYYNHVTNKMFYTETVDRILYLIKANPFTP